MVQRKHHVLSVIAADEAACDMMKQHAIADEACNMVIARALGYCISDAAQAAGRSRPTRRNQQQA